MPRRKRSKCKKKSKQISEDMSVIVENVEVHSHAGESEERRDSGHPERDDSRRGLHSSSPAKQNGPGPKQKSSKDVYFAFLPDKYEPLTEDEAEENAEWREEEERRNLKKKEKYKKYRKNVGKALRFGWRCLVAGLQSFAGGYATPLAATSTLFTDAHRASRG